MPNRVLSAIRHHQAGLRRVTPRHILVVDDDEGVRKFVSRVLQDAGYLVTTASDGPEAIVRYQRIGRVDILATDLKMPLMAGDELARQLRRTDPLLRLLYLTGYADELFKERLTLWEGESYLDKPFTVCGLLEAVSLLEFGHLAPVEPARGRASLLRRLIAR